MLIYSHNPHSQGARALSEALGIRRIRHQGSRFTGRRSPTVINWGASNLPDWERNCTILNNSLAVAQASNKLTFFQLMEGHDLTPPFTTDPAVAQQWALERSRSVVCRHLLNASSGRGVEIVAHQRASEGLPGAPLYVEYIPKSEEYRVHIFQGEVIDVQRKARRRAVNDDEVNWQIRNHHNGFIYAREGATDSPGAGECCDKAREAFALTGLDFGAVDCIWNRRQKRGWVLEVNTAPGLEGTTVTNYANAFKRLM